MSNDPQYTFYSQKVPHAGKMKNRRCVLCKHTGDCSLPRKTIVVIIR